jgi:hypothetical protein
LDFDGEVPKDLRPGSAWNVELSEPDVLVLQRDGAPLTGYFAGSLSAISMGELFGYLLSGVRSGRLTVTQRGARKQVALRDGQVTFAVSSEARERLGVAVVSLGMVSAEDVDRAAKAIRPGERLGGALTRLELMTPGQLYEAMVWLVKEIVLNLFDLTEGTFLFVEGAPARADAVKLPERTRDLVLSGILRAEELHRLRRRWPNDARLRAAGTAEGAEEPLLEHAAAGGSVGELHAALGGAEYAFLSKVDELVGKGFLVHEVKEEPVRVPSVPSQGTVLDLYRNLVAELARALTSAGKGVAGLRAYLGEPGPRLKKTFEGVTLTDDGVLDVARIQANLGGEEEAMVRAMTYEALDAFVSYSLFSAQNALPPEAFAPLDDLARKLRGGDS